MWIGTEDARQRGIADGDRIEVYNDVGKFITRATVSPAVRPGYVIMYHAWEDYQFEGGSGHRDVMASPLKPLELAGGYREEDDDVDQLWVSQLTDRLLRTEVEMDVTLGRAELSVKELLNLKKGDIVLLENNYKHPIRASIAGIPKYEGFVGRYNSKKVFKVEQEIHPRP